MAKGNHCLHSRKIYSSSDVDPPAPPPPRPFSHAESDGPLSPRPLLRLRPYVLQLSNVKVVWKNCSSSFFTLVSRRKMKQTMVSASCTGGVSFTWIVRDFAVAGARPHLNQLKLDMAFPNATSVCPPPPAQTQHYP